MKWNNIQLGVWLMNGQANRSIGLLNPIACHHSHRSVIVPVPCDTSLARAVQCTRSSTIIKISQDIPSPEYQTKSISRNFIQFFAFHYCSDGFLAIHLSLWCSALRIGTNCAESIVYLLVHQQLRRCFALICVLLSALLSL